MSTMRPVQYAGSNSAIDIPDALRIAGLLFIQYVALVGAEAFHDLRSVSNVSVSEDGNLLNQILFSAVGVAIIAVLMVRGINMLRPLASTPALMTLAWFIATTVLSTQPMLSVRRLVLLLICTLSAACVFLLARSVRQLAIVLSVTALLIIGVSYVSLLVVPDLAIHSAFDLREPEHDGSWRGIFPHKNSAGAAMVIFLFVGLFAARVVHPLLGYMVVLLSIVFLAFTRAKTPIGMLPIVLVQSWLCMRWTGTARRLLVVAGPLLFALTITVGTAFLPPVKNLVGAFLPDPTYTGRTAIWDFAADNIAKRPITGFGYGAFWQTESTFYGASDALTWVNQAGDAHDGYLNTAVEVGWPGLALTIVWLVIEPILNLKRGRDGPALDPVNLLLLRWLCFGLLSAVFEGVLYHPTNGGFFIIMVAVFGLRYRTKATLRPA